MSTLSVWNLMDELCPVLRTSLSSHVHTEHLMHIPGGECSAFILDKQGEASLLLFSSVY